LQAPLQRPKLLPLNTSTPGNSPARLPRNYKLFFKPASNCFQHFSRGIIMAINAVSSSATAATVGAPATQSLRKTTQSSEASETKRVSVANANFPKETNNNDVQQTQRVQTTAPTINAKGQAIGRTINETA
jgi:hypothetical protein